MKEEVIYGVFILQREAKRLFQLSTSKLKDLSQALKVKMTKSSQFIRKHSPIVWIQETNKNV